MKTLSIVLAVLGVSFAVALIVWFDAGRVFTAALSVGWHGFALLCLWQGVLFATLGLAWDVLLPRGERHPFVITWGRMVRDAAGNCLPFSQMGGYVLGARALTLHGIAWPVATASTIVDVTAEFIAQVIFAAAGLVILLARQPNAALVWPLGVALLLALVAVVAFIRLQRAGSTLFAALGRRIARTWFDDAADRVAALQAEIESLYASRVRLVACTVIHLLAWTGTGIGGWIAFRLLGADIDLVAALAIEALLHAALALVFLVPGYAGIQEAAYTALGALFGVPAELALGVSLVRRARDFAVGIPILLIWQGFELRRFSRRRTPG